MSRLGMTEAEADSRILESEEAWNMMNMTPQERKDAAEALEIVKRAERAEREKQIAGDAALALSMHSQSEHDAIRSTTSLN